MRTAIKRAVSYTHLDVYKRQIPFGAKMMVVDGADVPLLEIRSVVWSAPEKESQDASA